MNKPPDELYIVMWNVGNKDQQIAGPYLTEPAAEQAATDMATKHNRTTAVCLYGFVAGPSAVSPPVVIHEEAHAALARASDDKVIAWAVECFRCRTYHIVSADEAGYHEGAQHLCVICQERARMET